MTLYAKNSEGKQIVGTLMRIEEDPLSRYRFEIWFDYTRDVINTLGEGAMITVPNFHLDPRGRDHEWASVLEITTMLPVHYAIGDTMSGFPGFLEEAARSAGQDWIDQETEATDDTTKIKCVAIPTNLMMDDDGNLVQEQGLPMVGHPARLLDTATTQKLANLGIDIEADHVARMGPLLRDEDVSIYLRIEDALKTHFAIFGFTGAGKSNLLSTSIAKFLGKGDGPPVKLVVFDLMSEFAVLLADLLADLPHAGLVAVGPETLPNPVLDYYAAPEGDRPSLLDAAAMSFAQTTLYPKRLKPHRDRFRQVFARMLSENRLRVWQERERTLAQFITEHEDEIRKGRPANNDAPVIQAIFSDIQTNYAVPFTQANVDSLLARIQQDKQNVQGATASTWLRVMETLIRREQERLSGQRDAPANCRVRIPGIVERLNSDDGSSLIVVQAADPDELREFAANLGNALYESRRRSGQIEPLVSFIFDEADEFIPLTADYESQKRSTAIAHTLARRGRKFGLGLGIATQRVTYLNTSIMAQPHTYFISKLPRKSDRDRVCEAFGISEDMFRQTFKFRKGDWLIVSHEATGLESVPLPIHTENADERILNWLDEQEF